MPDVNVIIGQSNIVPKERVLLLAKVYQFILSWEKPKEEYIEPTTGNLGRESVGGSVDEQQLNKEPLS